ncbi:MAG: hypothetical protein N2651_08605 [Fimbriimonadales bacterium]|nr:hypothetical protein [Fimbriimonadales bacterium]
MIHNIESKSGLGGRGNKQQAHQRTETPIVVFRCFIVNHRSYAITLHLR